MEPKAVGVLLCREAMSKESLHRLGGDADAVVDDLDLHTAAVRSGNTRCHGLIRAPRCITGVLGVALQVDVALQHLVLVDGDLGYRFELADQRHTVPYECPAVHGQDALPQRRDCDTLSSPA